MLAVLVLACVHHLQRKCLRVDIRELMAKRVDQIRVVLLVQGILEELMAFDPGQLFDQRSSEQEALEVVLEVGELFVEARSEDVGDSQVGVSSSLQHKIKGNVPDPKPEDHGLMRILKPKPGADGLQESHIKVLLKL